MARSLATISRPSLARLAGWLRRPHLARLLALVLTVAATLSGHRDLRRAVGLAQRRRRRRAGPRPALSRPDPAAAARRRGRAPPGASDHGAPAGLGRLAAAWPPGGAVQPGRGGAGDRGRGVLGDVPALRPRGLVQRADQRRADQLAERRPGLSRGAQGGDPRRRPGDGGRSQPRRAGPAARGRRHVPAAARRAGGAPLADRGDRVPERRRRHGAHRPELRARDGAPAALGARAGGARRGGGADRRHRGPGARPGPARQLHRRLSVRRPLRRCARARPTWTAPAPRSTSIARWSCAAPASRSPSR